MKKQITISNFNLTYDGMYHLCWEKYDLRVFLSLSDLMKMLKIEGYTVDDFDKQIEKAEPLLFTKTELLINVEIEDEKIKSFYTSDFSEFYYMYDEQLFLIEIQIK